MPDRIDAAVAELCQQVASEREERSRKRRLRKSLAEVELKSGYTRAILLNWKPDHSPEMLESFIRSSALELLIFVTNTKLGSILGQHAAIGGEDPLAYIAGWMNKALAQTFEQLEKDEAAKRDKARKAAARRRAAKKAGKP